MEGVRFGGMGWEGGWVAWDGMEGRRWREGLMESLFRDVAIPVYHTHP